MSKKSRNKLRKAKKALDKIRRLQIKTMSLYRHAIRMAAADGGAVREIAAEVGMSHQRVHQILQAGCDLCTRPLDQLAQLVQAGKRLTFCDQCVDRATAFLQGELQAGKPRFRRARASNLACNSCGKRSDKVDAMLSAGTTKVCSDCWRLAAEIMEEAKRAGSPLAEGPA